jgi:hypothetical protein
VSQIALVVTKREYDHSQTNPKEKQIAIRFPSQDIEAQVRALSSANRAHLKLGGFITLDVADPGAIWLAHNAKHAEAFEALFLFLATKPDGEMRFICDLSPLPT